MRSIKVTVITVVCLSLLVGCGVDARIKRQASLNSVRVQTAQEEFKLAETPEEKVAVADEYFKTAPRAIRVVDDYLHGRDHEREELEPPLESVRRAGDKEIKKEEEEEKEEEKDTDTAKDDKEKEDDNKE